MVGTNLKYGSNESNCRWFRRNMGSGDSRSDNSIGNRSNKGEFMIIWGAGLAGLLAGTQFQTATIVEAGPEGMANHMAVLRFRTSAVGDATGIPFRKVKVYK